MSRRSVEELASRGFGGASGPKFPLTRTELHKIVAAALQEDDVRHDITSVATIVSDRRTGCRMVARQSGVVAGLPLAREAFRQLDAKLHVRSQIKDGSRVGIGTPLMFLRGHPRCLLSAERVALNFVQHLSGIATLTARYAAAVRGTGARILDTRKTLPGWRKLEKYAVAMGGGMNHRFDLGSAVLIKDNHLAALGGDIAAAVKRARSLARRGTIVEVECDRLSQVGQAVAAGADVILLDNMKPRKLAEAVKLIAGRAVVEASGGVNLDSVRAIAESGVNWISVGAITHSAPALDIALDFD